MECFCDSKIAFKNCCEGVISKKNASSPLALMRSRFSAFATGNAEYILATQNPLLHQHTNVEKIYQDIKNQRFFLLEIVDKYEKTVHFRAHFIEGEIYHIIEEVSEFMLIDGMWRYEKALKFEHESETIKRNSLCPCGSKKKFKQCHMR